MFISLFFSSLAMAGDCSIPIPQSMFDTKLNDVEEALRNRDSTLMTQKMEQLTESIPCLAQPVTQIQASRYHTLQGISQFLNKDINRAQLYFSSAQAANSQAIISTDFYPENHMIHKLFADAPEANDGDNLEAPAKGSLLFDGLNSSTRPSYRPTIYQHIQNGKSVSSALLEPLQEMPDYVTETEAKELEKEKEKEKEKQAEKPVEKPVEKQVEQDSQETVVDKQQTPNSDIKKSSKKRMIGATMMVLGGVSSGLVTSDQLKIKTATSDKEVNLLFTDVSTITPEEFQSVITKYYIANSVGGLIGLTGLYLFVTGDK